MIKIAGMKKRGLRYQGHKVALAKAPLPGLAMLQRDTFESAALGNTICPPAAVELHPTQGTIHHPPAGHITVEGSNIGQGPVDQVPAGQILVAIFAVIRQFHLLSQYKAF